MALLAWEVVRLSTLNKIFIRRMDFTMRKNAVVTKGQFHVIWSETAESSLVIQDSFSDWYSAYRAFRYHVSFCGHEYVSLRYSSDLFSPTISIVWYLCEHGQVGIKWYDGALVVREGDCA